MTSNLRRTLLLGVALSTITPCAVAQTQQSSGEEADEQVYRADNMQLEEIVVTGRVGAANVTKFESAVAITSFSAEALREQAPLSPADLYAEIPGFHSEPSGGEVGNNVFPRGLPQPGSFRFLKLQEDGLPIMEVQELAFVNADTLLRLDDSVRRVEAVRGGTSSIFASNAAGGIINHITRKGTQDFEGGASLEWGDFNHYRFDGYVSGPISDDVLFSVGGFWRSNDGIRDPGFRANSGGQIRANVTYMFDRGSLELRGKVVDEENIFYLPIPLQRDGNKISGIPGFDPNTDTLTSADARLASLLRPGGEVVNRDLSDGVKTQYTQVGGKFEYELGDGWLLSNNFRFTEGDVLFNAIFSLTNPTDAESFLSDAVSRLNDGGFTDVTQAEFRFATSGDVITDPTGLNGNGLIVNSGWWTTETDFQNIINDFQVNKQFSLGDFGEHSFTTGFYFSDVDLAQFWNFNSVVQEVRGRARLLDVVGQDAAGNDIASATLNGFSSFGDFFRRTSSNLRVISLYAFDEWQVTDDLRIDIGVRYQDDDLDGQVENLRSFTLEDNPLSPEQTGDLPTLADDSGTFGAGTFTPFDVSNEEVSFAVGANYTFSPSLAVYARYNSTSRTPDVDDFAGNPDDGFPVQDVKQAEVGIKLDLPYFRAFLTGFYSELTDIPFNDEVIDPDTGNLVTLDLRADAENIGIEVEGAIGPFYDFDIQFNATLQDPDFVDFGDNTGNQVSRVPKSIVNIKPGYRYDFGDVTGRVFLNFSHTGDRFVDLANNTTLPDYQTVGVGLTAFWDNFVLEFHGENLTNTIGLTEGNPRTDQVVGTVGSGTFMARPILGRSFRVSIGYEF